MILRLIAVLSIVVPLFADSARVDKIQALAGSCTRAVVSGCDTETFGTLETGDCTLDDGTRFDRLTFNGTAGQIVEVTLRTLSSGYTNPLILLAPPLGDTTKVPLVWGGSGGASVTLQLSSTGQWTILVGTDDLFGAGNYVVHVYCYAPSVPPLPSACVYQSLLCGQTATWSLTAESCRFNTNQAYVGWWIYGVAGDRLQFRQGSNDFSPLFGIYRNGELLASSALVNSVTATLAYRVPTSAWYYVLTTSAEPNVGGDYTLELDCSGSGCIFPYLLTDRIPSQTVKRGTSATIPFNVTAVGGFQAKLMEDLTLIATSSTSVLTTPPITSRHTYYVEIENACGSWFSNDFTVGLEPSRRRSVRH